MVNRQRTRRAMQISGIALGVGLTGFVMRQCWSRISRQSSRTNRCLTKYEKSFRIPDAKAITLVKDFEEQLQKGLHSYDGSSLKMLPSCITNLPTGFEKGDFYAIDVGGTNLRIMHCQLGDLQNEVLTEDRKEIEIPANRKTGKIHNLFDFIVNSFRIYLQMTRRDFGSETIKVGFCFSFPLKMEGLDVGHIEKLTKGFSYEDAIGEDAVKLLRDTFAANEMNVEVRVVCNDALGVLAAGRYADPRTEIGIVLGTGTNAACVETVKSISKWTPGLPDDILTAVNIEWGDFASSDLPRVEEDFLLDLASQCPGEQLFEQMVCGEFIGELCRLLILSLHNDGALFKRGNIGHLKRPYSLSCAAVAKITSDESHQRESAINHIKLALDTIPSLEEAKLITKVCDIVVERAALLIACALAATIYHVRRDGTDPGHPVVISIDGSTYLKFTKFKDCILSETKRILRATYGCGHPTFEVVPYAGASCLGAAVLTAASVSNVNGSVVEYSSRFPELPFLDQ